MASSAKKKKQKKKDFQKPQLKVGKAKPKAANFTDTSFKARSIVIKKQSVSTVAPTVASQIDHHLSLLKSPSDGQRRESLAFLANLPVAQLSSSVLAILTKLPPLIHDGSPAVRQQLLKLLNHRPADVIASHQTQVAKVLVWIRTGMNHLSSDIRSFSLDVLRWLVESVGTIVVDCAGGWTGTLRCFMTSLGWNESSETTGWSKHQTSGARLGEERKELAKQLFTLASFLRVGLSWKHVPENEIKESRETSSFENHFPFIHTPELWQLPTQVNALAHLNLFGEQDNPETAVFHHVEARQEIFEEEYRETIHRGIEKEIKEGGDVGRAAATVKTAMEWRMGDLQAARSSRPAKHMGWGEWTKRCQDWPISS